MDEDPLNRRTLFTILGIPWKLTPTFAQFIPSRLASGLVIAFIFLRAETFGVR